VCGIHARGWGCGKVKIEGLWTSFSPEMENPHWLKGYWHVKDLSQVWQAI